MGSDLVTGASAFPIPGSEHAPPKRGRVRPPYRQWRLLGLVALGGALGTTLRALVTMLVPADGAFPVATFAINLVGAFVLGLLLEVLTRSGPDDGWRRRTRLLVGTGVLGGFTTYSALATATAELTVDGFPWWAIGYALGTVVIGAVLSTAGIAFGAALTRTREARS
jgi:CrcB protein